MLLRRIYILCAAAVFLFPAGCSDAGSDTQPQSDTRTPAPSAAAEESQQKDAENKLPEADPSLGNLLPQRLAVLAAPFFGDLDAMEERRAIRTLVVPGGPQFFYYQGMPRGM
ncbi:MAG: hypothetical protein WBM57_06115, partial [Woeseiaceae bacterium]